MALTEAEDVDKLFAEYEAQAKADSAAAERKTLKLTNKRQKSMKEIRQEGLDAPIANDNKGFQMLAAMGYQPGRGLGRGLAGQAAPVPVQLKAGRQGVGIEQNKRRKQQEVEQQQKERDLKRARMQQDMRVEHTNTTATKAAHRRAEAHLLQARQVCETLDRRKGVESSEMWPQPPAAAVESDAIQENEAQDSSTSAVEEVAQEPSWEDWPVQAKLALVLDYLRQTYHYCIFCGSQYGDEHDMSANCPGLQEVDH
ncbi:hypothetical protein WJX82_007548 [Trebouxia sp. C0006]